MKRSTLVLGVALLAASGAVLSACGGSSNGGGGTKPASNAPIRLMVDVGITPSNANGGLTFPGGSYGAKAAADALNKTGGINGHMVQIDVCDNKSDPNVSVQCGRTAKSNGDIAVVGSFDSFGAQELLPVLQAENIPYVGPLPSSTAELTSPISFPFDPGTNLANFGLAQVWINSGCKSVVQIDSPVPGISEVVAAQRKTLQGNNIAFDNESLAINGSNLTPIITTGLAHHPDCLTITGPPPIDLQVFTTARKLGYTGKLITTVGAFPSIFLSPLGAAGNGLIALNTALSPTSSDPMVKEYYADLLAYYGGDMSKTMQNANEFSQVGWSAVQLVKQALLKAGSASYSGPTLIKTIPTMCSVNVGNFFPQVNFCKALPSKTYTRVFSDQYQLFTAKNGQYVATNNQWLDLSNTVPN